MASSKKKNCYATIQPNEGIDYRDIAETMTLMGYTMNHSSARNYVLRVMKKFVDGIATAWNICISDQRSIEIAKSSEFQSGIAEILQEIEFSNSKTQTQTQTQRVTTK